MNYSNKIDLEKFFSEIDLKYCVVKLSEDYPNYYAYSDIDIFCYDVVAFTHKILDFAKNYIENGWKVQVIECCENHVQVDFYEEGADKLDFKFDLYNALPKYKKVILKEGLFTLIVEFAQKNEQNVFVPGKIEECILRYVEYIENYDIRADKIKHVDYIMQKLSNEDAKTFFERLHYYTKFPLDISEKEFTPGSKFKRPLKTNPKLKWLCNPAINVMCWFTPIKSWRKKLREYKC
jgi:hypothetical protein